MGRSSETVTPAAKKKVSRTRMLDAYRNVWTQRVSFLSIVVVAMLAVMTYLGIAYAAKATARSASEYYGGHRMWDLEIVSTLLMDEEDLEAIRAVEGVELAEPVLQLPTTVSLGGEKKEAVNLLSLPGEIATIDLIEGRMPESAGECLAEEWLANRSGFSVGQKLSAYSVSLAGIDALNTKEFIITGIFRHPDHITRQVQFTPYLLVRDECFNLEALDGSFMKARVLVKDAPADRYSKEYLAAVNTVEKAISELGEVRAPLRTEKLRDKYNDLLQEQQAKLDEAEKELLEGRRQLDEGWEMLATSAEELIKGKDKLEEAAPALYEASVQLKNAAEELKQGRIKLARIELLLKRGVNWITTHIDGSHWPSDIGFTYDDFVTALNKGEAWVMRWIYNKSGYTAGMYTFSLANAQFTGSSLDWYYFGEEYMDAATLYDQAKKKLEQGEKDYNEGLAQFEDALRRIEEARQKIDEIGICHWVVLDNSGNSGYVFAEQNSRSIESLSTSFSLIFIIIGALVIYATVGRMVEEQSKLVGTTKALGLFNREIRTKYLIFGGGGTVLGIILGIAASYFLLQKMVLSSQGRFFIYGTPASVFLPRETLIVTIGGILLAVLSVSLACGPLLHVPAIQLISGAATTSKVSKAARKSGSGGLYRRLILLNMRSDLKRVIVTIVSVAGCCLLLVIGFYIKFGISRVNDRQFGPEAITRYDAELYFDTAEDPEAEKAFAQLLNEQGLPAISARKEDIAFRPDESMTAGVLLCADADEIGDFFGLLDPDSGAVVREPDSGVLITKKLHEYYGLKPGDSFEVYNGGMDLITVQVAGVFDNHFGHVLVFSPEAYREAFGTEVERNCFLVKTGDMSLDQLENLARSVPGFSAIKDAAAEKARFNEMSSMVTLVIVAMIVIAGLMAYFIIVNLSKTYIQKKRSELTIMRINGFTTGECIRYAAWDLIITTVIGIVIGLILGGVLGRGILCLMEQPFTQFVRTPDWRSFVLGGLITVAFSLIINTYALSDVKKLKLSDIS